MNQEIVDQQWLPPSPHREEVLRVIRIGRAHVEERGHNVPPLLVYEDGGTMELPRVRFAEGKFVASEGSEPAKATTRYLDVCGTVAELKRLVEEEPEAVLAHPDRLMQLTEDAHYMISRMERRLQTYRAFSERVEELCEGLKAIRGPDPNSAYERIGQIHKLLEDDSAGAIREKEALFEFAEGLRGIAGRLEKMLYAYRDVAIELGALYGAVKGARNWTKS
jgi:hypothetical protein